MNVERLAAVGFLAFALLLGYIFTSSGSSSLPSPRTRELGVIHLDAFQLFDAVLSPKMDYFQGGPNHKGVVWAVFFYRPYCGACRRVRPAYEALAQTTNATNVLRFAAMDCTKYKTFCDKHGGDKQPRIVLFAYPQPQASSRVMLAAWEGMLIATDVIQWFKDVQKEKGLSETIEWASNDVLAKAITAFKATGEAQYDPLIVNQLQQNKSGYLLDIQSALSMGLTDHVFKENDALQGSRLRAMIKWVTAVAKVYPEQDTRNRLTDFRKLLLTQDQWSKTSYEDAVTKKAKFALVSEDTPGAWVWCVRAGPGVGGYPCGLWVLFHTLMANSEKTNAVQTLDAIALFIHNFFGCEECVRHFSDMWKSDKGGSQSAHIDSSIWLWKAHNQVRARLAQDDTTTQKEQWPSVTVCPECYTEAARNGSSRLSTRDYVSEQWREGYVFEMLQEAFCYQSDLLSCAQFWDPSDTYSSTTRWSLKIAGLVVLVAALLGVLAFLIFSDSDKDEEPMPSVTRNAKTHLRQISKTE